MPGLPRASSPGAFASDDSSKQGAEVTWPRQKHPDELPWYVSMTPEEILKDYRFGGLDLHFGLGIMQEVILNLLEQQKEMK